MKQKNFVIEVLDSGSKRTFIVREISPMPNVPPVTKCVTSDPMELAQFFGSDEIFVSDGKN